MGKFRKFILNEDIKSEKAKANGLEHISFNNYKDKNGGMWHWDEEDKEFSKKSDEENNFLDAKEFDGVRKYYNFDKHLGYVSKPDWDDPDFIKATNNKEIREKIRQFNKNYTNSIKLKSIKSEDELMNDAWGEVYKKYTKSEYKYDAQTVKEFHDLYKKDYVEFKKRYDELSRVRQRNFIPERVIRIHKLSVKKY